MKIEIEVSDTILESIIENLLVGKYGMNDLDEDFEDKIQMAMKNDKFLNDIKENIVAEIEDNSLDSIYQYARDFTVKSPKYYGFK